MRDIDPDSEEMQRQARDNANYVGGLQLEQQHQMHRDLDTISAMRSCGGSFVKALATACGYADASNLARIKAAFPEIWEFYSKLPAVE